MNTTQATLSLYLTKGSNTLDCYISIGWKALLMTNTTAYWGYSLVAKKIKCCEYCPACWEDIALTKLFWSSNYSLERHCLVDQDREVLLKGKAQYSWPPCTNQFRSQPFHIENISYFFTKQTTLMRRSIVLSLPLQLMFPDQGNSTRERQASICSSNKILFEFCSLKR